MNQSELITFALAGFVAALILFKAGIFLAVKGGLVDKPGGRKKHEGSVALIGGLVIIPVFAVLSLLAGINALMPLLPLLGGMIFLLVMGAIDDKFGIHPWARFVLQIWVACYVVIFCGASLENLGNLFGFGDVYLGWFGKYFSVICLVLLMNAINMLDGVDGLAGGFIAVSLGWLMLAAYDSNYIVPFWAMMFLLMPVLAFLVYNARHPLRKRASVFLGDAGSLSLAIILGWFAIKMAQIHEPKEVLAPVVIIWIMTVPIMDTFAIFFTRMRQGRSPFEADRLHTHHQLIDKGIDPKWVTPIILSFALLTGGMGYFGIKAGVPEYILLYSWSAILGLYTYYRVKNA
jgi:UDP-GlcNAc:undecaprenyl-phosphate GlcNAc-1-phosphate transferase